MRAAASPVHMSGAVDAAADVLQRRLRLDRRPEEGAGRDQRHRVDRHTGQAQGPFHLDRRCCRWLCPLSSAPSLHPFYANAPRMGQTCYGHVTET